MALINPSPDILDSELKLYRYWNLRGIIEASSNASVADMLGKKTSYITAIAGPANFLSGRRLLHGKHSCRAEFLLIRVACCSAII